jgi:hypothetical protein
VFDLHAVGCYDKKTGLICLLSQLYNIKGKTIAVEARTGPGGSGRMRLADFVTFGI